MSIFRFEDRTHLFAEAEKIHAGYVDGLNCAERVFWTVQALVNTTIPREAVRLLSGFGGGIGGCRDGVCGAVSGGVAALGLLHGRPNPPTGDREWAYVVSRDFVNQFRTAFGSTVCRDLVGDLLREASAEAEASRKARCCQYTWKAVQLCLDTLARYTPPQ
ncbi:MAG TPA: C-GCAxxG-C-C family protein [Candidatus Baltobacteraceae bacterium]|nr:C-GCAxxG-C-C family protein [Candidatus Baltobacteraceae bacterium]